jgi:WD40 repeat protein
MPGRAGIQLRLHAARRRIARQPEQVRYNAFLSYSHRADGALAPRLRSALQSFARRWNQLRALRVFLDAASLAANPGLWPAIASSLDDSEFLLLLASPEAASSRYVAKELEHWRTSKPEGQILIALTAGDIVWDETAGDFDWDQTTALSEVLRGAFTTEPRWVDLRWARDAPALSLRDDRFRAAVADLAATMHHRDKDELAGEDVRQHRRTTLLARGGSLTLAVLAAATTVAAVLFLRERDSARDQTKVSLSRQLAAQSALARDSRVDAALVLGTAALAVKPTIEARSALFGALAREPRLEKTLWTDGEISTPAVFIPPSGRLVAAGNDRAEVTVWDRETGRQVRTLKSGLPWIGGLTVSADGFQLVAKGENDRVLWDIRSDAPTGTLLPSQEVMASVFAPDGRLATSSSDDSIFIERPPRRKGHVVAPARGRGYVGAMAFDSTGAHLVAVGPNGAAQVWATRRQAPPLTLARAQSGGGLLSVAWHGDEIAAGTHNGRIARWNLRRPRTVRTDGDGDRPVSSVAYSPDGRVIAAADGLSVVLMDARTGKLNDRFATSGQATSVAFSPDGSVLATSGTGGGVSVWSARARRPLARELAMAHPVTALAFSRSGRTLAAGAQAGPVAVWDTRTGVRRSASSPSGWVQSLAFDASGTRLAAAGAYGERVRVLDPRTGDDVRPAVKVRGEEGAESVAIGGAGRLLATGDGRVRAWPPAGGSVGTTRVVSADTSGGSAMNASGTLSAFEKFDPASGFLDASLVVRDIGGAAGHDRVVHTGVLSQLAVAPAGDYIAAARNGSVSVYDAITGARRIGPLEVTLNPEQGITSVTVANGARTIAAGDSTGRVTLWDGDTGSRLGVPLPIRRGDVSALALSDDGRRLAIAARPGVVLISLDEVDWLPRVCPIANRGLTAFESRGIDAVKPERNPDPCRR